MMYKFSVKEEIPTPCTPSPCGINAVCKERNGAGSCSCIPEYSGNPYVECRPECVLNTDCPRNRACVNNKCVDPCPGTCGLNAECRVVNHSPTCTCLPGYIGNALSACNLPPPIREKPVPVNPCVPSPCGANSNCRVVNNHAVCSCISNYIGTPPNCRPECVVSSECGQDRACINEKCKDPCPGTCGIHARCQVVVHNPICSCPSGYTGDPFVSCSPEERRPVVSVPSRDPCVPSPCGPNSQCRAVDISPVCTCLPNYIGRAPNCRPECTSNSECPGYLACVNERCKDPCPGSCGNFATCTTVKHRPICRCVEQYSGDPFTGCTPIAIIRVPEILMPCSPSPCGINAICQERNGAGSCSCIPEYFGDPYVECRPECVMNSDCAKNRACVNQKCKDPCPGVCGLNAECSVINHAPTCMCLPGYTGNPSLSCHEIPKIVEPTIPVHPCRPSPCGPYSECREVYDHAVCSCQKNYIGAPPACRPECTVSSECSQDRSCINLKCVDPCLGTCGIHARCQVTNHNPICSCPPGSTGDPFVQCVPEERRPTPVEPVNPCIPSPCGPYSQCRTVGNTPVCTCLPNYIGRAPQCRPECVLNADCPANLACVNERCKDPCPGSCGFNALCNVVKHSPVCTCQIGFTGDPFSGCQPIPIIPPTEVPRNPCNPSPCGANAVCKERNGAGSCTCLPDYFGDPYSGCRPECVTNNDCARDKACINQKCKDPCPGVCGFNAECRVVNHAPSCVCLPGFTGNPLTSCHEPPPPPKQHVDVNPCVPSPCGPNSQCREVNSHAVCSCQTNYIGIPPNCRPECMISSECAQDKACVNQKCVDPCPGTCGVGAHCMVINHNPICSCSPGFVGDPFVRCLPEEKRPVVIPTGDPCVPSPCGPNSQCRAVGDTAACSCLPNYVGKAPNCRPECTINAECSPTLACVHEKCKDPCIGSCGINARCTVVNHNPVCQCDVGFTGDPFAICTEIPRSKPVPEVRNPCNPSPCGANAVCKERNGAGSCSCLPEYYGDPYSGCRPECVQNSDCDRSRACINNKCRDPCPGVCGVNAECQVHNHAPTCLCIPGYTGDPSTACRIVEQVTSPPPTNPCQPSPCGPNSICREVNSHAVCSCQPNFRGSPPNCRPECVVSSECTQDKACVNQRCIDPCPGTCGVNAKCQVVNHSPICSCAKGYTGDPFVRCSQVELPPPPRNSGNPCIPSPCGPNSQCRVIGDQAACSCMPNYVGRSPNCRPECTINAECSSNLACVNERCVDPCPGSCGSNALCSVVKHNPVCTCTQGYEGDPLVGCNPALPPSTERAPPPTPCTPSPCGPNAECRERNGAGACFCNDGFEGNPYDKTKGCRQECEINQDCAPHLSCSRNKCVDPCIGTCGTYAICTVDNHFPVCTCPPGYTGDPFFLCREEPVTQPPRRKENPCIPTPCGPNSNCRAVNEQAVCSCQPGYIGTPPQCRPECVVNSECPIDRACINQKCADPCPNTCGIQAHCSTRNHNPICACPPGFTGDPFSQCSRIQIVPQPTTTERPPSCTPSPCGPNSKCQLIGGNPACSCLEDYVGSPPNCRPECVLNSECSGQQACINQKCKDPCPGSCGFDAKCHVTNHVPICTCNDGFEGDPFIRCNRIPPTTVTPIVHDPCNPSPCGPNTHCNNGECTCIAEYVGNPYEGCRPECVLSSDCNRDKACLRNKCRDPCPGTCGQNAKCEVVNHIPICSCPTGYTGDPFSHCRVVEIVPEPKRDPCNPSPCGPNSQCRQVSDQAVCSCLQGFIGAPPQCRPECVISSECSQTQACINQKCVDPCRGACGVNARCEVINHSPICSCSAGQTGDPFNRCQPLPPPPAPKEEPIPHDPCNPSPCGPNSICRVNAGGAPSCQCISGYVGSPPNCRPECVINPDCPSHQACINNKCVDPCPGSCGTNAECRVISHAVVCTCAVGYTGNPFVQCVVQQQERINPCEPSPCGPNAECIRRNDAGACKCIEDYQGNPYEGCRPECVLSSDCPTDRACIRNKCGDPCPGVCGESAQCQVINHVPRCSCFDGYIGDPFTRCYLRPVEPVTIQPVDPCNPSPCGSNSRCRVTNGVAVCSCEAEYIGEPPNCRPECTVNAECPSNKACHKFKCANPCSGTCGFNARCEVINHNPICSCPPDMTGDPFTRCSPIITQQPPPQPRPVDPCNPSPCGLYAECQAIQGSPSCSCKPTYVGSPPNCRPECVVNTDCPSSRACIAEKCRDPCEGSCGFNSECRVQNHIPICTCRSGYTGDPFTQCTQIIERLPPVTPSPDPCDPSPCGSNTNCREGICSCIPNYFGDPYRGCRPECTMNTDCSPNKSCVNTKCIDPCPGTCGQDAKCEVYNHIPTCSCPPGFRGDPFVLCRQVPVIQEIINPCNPSPCGPNSICREANNAAVCTCQPLMVGSPPGCRPECVVSAECALQKACLNNKCQDPCPGTCGQNAKCQVINHNPICSCSSGYTGDPFSRCYEIPRQPPEPINVCVPSPCGPNAECRDVSGTPACSCLPNYIGIPPGCRPECTINPECPSTKACMNQRCADPCPGSCGTNARCSVINHTPICTCETGYTGDPFSGCVLRQEEVTPPPKIPIPCQPSPCGINARCRVEGVNEVCECIPEYHGNPYEGCRPECVGNSECPMNRACIRNKCVDPCPGTCGVEAECSVTNHIPICTCPPGTTGDAFRQCIRTPERVDQVETRDPCYPSPCGLNTLCRRAGENAHCECLSGYFGNPFGTGCRPECTINSDCARNLACINTKCVDPCPGICGFGAQCHVINHSPICSCPANLIGDPFVECKVPLAEPVDPCNPSPCAVNGICRVHNGSPVCTYPECVINSDCSRDRACFNQRCRDPCIDACGLSAVCTAINHKAVCSCPAGFAGSPYVECYRHIEPTVRPECVSDSECTNDKACINQKCVNPCLESNGGLCGQNAECHVRVHRPVCVCRSGFTGNAHLACYEIGCRSDSDCPVTQACVNRECVEPCSYTQCGTNAICRSDYNHKARCFCPDNYRGNPLVSCTRPECTVDADCPYHLACLNEHCRDPCNCAPGALCRVDNHRASCRCPPGYTGDGNVACSFIPIEKGPECTMDADCPSKLACFSGVCKNPCYETKPCAAHAICNVVDTLPLRTMVCQCEPGYVGDAEIECKLAPLKDKGCSSDSECSLTQACRNRICVNPCSDGNPCAKTAECRTQNHRAVCVCSPGMVGDPFVNCFREPAVTTPECRSNADCTDDKACVNKKCLNPCAEGNPCGGNAECRVALHRPLCYCPADWGGDPHVQCHRPECQVNDDCPYDKACYSGKCLNPCSYGPIQCGRGAECFAQNHRANCACPPGTQGNPMVSCITGMCQYNEDCADHEACDRLNRVCRPVCEAETCARDATCTGRNHQPVCECFPGTTGNPFVECSRPRKPVEPECRTDGDCPSKLACFEGRCENPCRKSNVCTSQDQICSVVDTIPYRTMLCKCPGDTVTNSIGKCIPIKLEKPVGCTSNADCADPEICTRGTCIVACHVEQCGINAQCTSSAHRARCSCAPGYEGNPLIECSPIPKIPHRPEPAECYKNDDCPFDRKCINELCVNPCTAGDPCGRGAVCFIENREPVCKCPQGYTGDPRVSCQPPSEATVGCKSNSECALSESCINRICANPCNCGQNAECKVVDHYPICFCRPGYSGNPQSGCVKHECTSDFDCSDDKTCLTGQCVNPCIVNDPCAINAECYGHSHRAACRCNPGLEGNPFERCVRVECHSDFECPDNRACIDSHCVNPCATDAHPPCAQNALCYPRNHRATCHCPEELPLGNPFSYCERKVIPPSQPECVRDTECPSKLACIDNRCQDPCGVLKPCASSAKCSVLNSVPVRTMICECPELWVPDTNGECRQLIIQTPPGCASDSECPDNEACINRQCRNPCNCGTHATCLVQNHRAICSCEDGYHGNPNVACRTVGCRTDSECDSGKACINQNCVSPCLVRDPCGTNAECYVYENKAQCRCVSGFRGNPWERCHVVGCRSNSDCPTDKNCENAQCVNPCVYGNICSPRAECRPQNHMAVCRCPPGFLGNPYVDCRPEPVPECVVDTDCSPRLACIDQHCQDPCLILEPCHRPSICEVVPSSPVRTMICICPEGYVSSGSGTCKPTEPVLKVGGCIADSDCASDKACVNGICRNPCNCGPNAECRIKDHKPVCSCEQGYEGNPEIECIRIGCRSNDECSGQHSCINRQCVPVCAADGRSCGERAQCYGINHRAVCECLPGYSGDPRQACLLLGCRSDSDCPFDKACINNKCQDPCEKTAVCAINEICQVYNHRPECACPPGYISDYEKGCRIIEDICRNDGDCPTQTACIGSECINPCNATKPCGVNAECKVFDTIPVRTMVCVCLPDYQGNAAVQCDKRSLCNIEKGFVRDIDGKCVCPPGSALNIYNECMQCRPEAGYKIDETGHCVCALERGMVIDERGRCICPIEHGYRLTERGECIRTDRPECESNDECPDHRYCNLETKTCEDPCVDKRCGINALCNATNHQAICQCIAGYTGEPEIQCNHTNFRTDFPQPEMVVSCLADGVQVKIHIAEPGFNGVLYVKGHSKDEECRRVVNLDSDSAERTELFKVHFGSCGLIHVNGIASFVLVIQKHPKLVTYKAQAYHIKCVYQTGEQNVTIGFNVSMLTTAGTIANTGPPPICSMKIVSYNGQEITSAEIGDNLMLQVDVQPATIYGGFARGCVAKTMEENVENEYIVTDDDGCATDPSIFGEWEYNSETNSLLASFNAFKFPSSDNIRFQCNIRVCFGRCQPVNCRGYDAFGKRRRRRQIEDTNVNRTSTALAGNNFGLEGQLREEIVIQSNAILTFERKEERLGDSSNISPAAQRVEDICVSMVGLIIALVITALLALVAVAVAVSCWLMAYRRQPKTTGPLPHPPEFPNPLFANPETVPEPAPDYLS